MAEGATKRPGKAAGKQAKAEQDPTYTVAGFAKVTGCDRHTIQKRLTELSAEPVAKSKGQGAGKFSLRDLVKAASLSTDADEMRLRKTTAETEKLELANARARGEMVEVAAVKKLGERVMIAIRQRLLNMPLTDEEKDACLRELMDLAKIDWTREP
jgi:phage terminase Nu1 subunit (DNA packaging protein)